jgi:hypothetical protein
MCFQEHIGIHRKYLSKGKRLFSLNTGRIIRLKGSVRFSCVTVAPEGRVGAASLWTRCLAVLEGPFRV